MLDYSEFKKILDLNSSLSEDLKTCPEEEREEIQMKIDSNLYALKIMADRIEDSETKEAFLNGIQSMTNTTKIEEKIEENRNILIDEELLKNSKILRRMAEDFKMSLKEDDKIVERVGNKMTKNSVENDKSLQIFEKSGGFVKSSTFLSISLIIFVFVYGLIRFS